MSVRNSFVHEPLDLTRNTIRVLSILRPGRGSLIRCTIRQIPREDRHLCLSYTWGDESDQSPIELNGKPFMVRRNLMGFLHRAWPDYRNELLWIDAICIDQGNVAERNHQVLQMIDIFSTAKFVLIWTGPISTKLLEFVRTVRDSPRRPRHTKQTDGRPIWADTLRDLASRPYWTRRWIIQEIRLARCAFILMDFGVLPWTDFAKAYHSQLPHKIRPWIVLEPDLHLSDIVRGPRADEGSLSWANTLRTFDRACCAIDHDRIYALNGLMEPSERVAVDYDQDHFHLFFQVATVAEVLEHSALWQWYVIATALNLQLGYFCGRSILQQAPAAILAELQLDSPVSPMDVACGMSEKSLLILVVIMTDSGTGKNENAGIDRYSNRVVCTTCRDSRTWLVSRRHRDESMNVIRRGHKHAWLRVERVSEDRNIAPVSREHDGMDAIDQTKGSAAYELSEACYQWLVSFSLPQVEVPASR